MKRTEFTDKEMALYDRLHQLAHAVQTGVKYEMEKDPANSATSLKHLRTGVNMAMVENAALVELLIEKGVITLEEILARNCEKMQEEVEKYEERLSYAFGAKISLL